MSDYMVHLGRIAYNAYRQSAGGRSLISGDELPRFDDLPVGVKNAWITAGGAVYKATTNMLIEYLPGASDWFELVSDDEVGALLSNG